MSDEWAKAQAGIQLGMQAELDALKANLAAARADADILRSSLQGSLALALSRGTEMSEVIGALRAALDATPATGQGAARPGTVAMVEQTRQALADIEQHGRGGVQVLIEPDIARQFVVEQGDLP